jgi:hypothetical protein
MKKDIKYIEFEDLYDFVKEKELKDGWYTISDSSLIYYYLKNRVLMSFGLGQKTYNIH